MTETFTLLGGKLTLTGPHPAEDALWLAASVTPSPGSHVLDAMAGIGTVGLALTTRCPGLTVQGVEANPALSAIAATNATHNNQPGYAVHTGTLETFQTNTLFNYAFMNPPFHATQRGHSTPNTTKALAHGLPPQHLTLWLKCLYRLLTPTGTMALILHSACQPEVLAFAQANACTATLQPLETSPNKPAKRLLAQLTKSNAFTQTNLPALPVHNPSLRNNILAMAKGLAAPSSQDG